MAVAGIDLGTTNTVVASVRDGGVHVLADEQGRRLLPSVVSFHADDVVLVGHAAKERRIVDARNTVVSVKRLIGRPWNSSEIQHARQRFAFDLREGPDQGPVVLARGQEYTLPEISAFVLRRAKEIAERALGEPVERAVITVPAHFNELQRATTKVAGRVAGLDVLRIINEPTAAALAYGRGRRSSKERVAVYDFGGGTFDCTLLDLSGNVFEVLATAGDSFLGGDDVDLAIAERMAGVLTRARGRDPRADPQSFERLRASAELLKIELSTRERATARLRPVLAGDASTHRDVEFAMTRPELEALAAPLLDRTLAVCQEALSMARMPAGGFDEVILVGGSTRIPFVRRRVEQFFGRRPLDRVSPDEVVAVGAAIQAAALTEAYGRRSIPPPPVPSARPSAPSFSAACRETLPAVSPLRAGEALAPAPASRPASPPPPVLVDVTPRALVVETVGGWCDTIVPRNAKIPCERSRAFTTSSHGQTGVRVRVAQGEDPVFGANTYLGEVDLSGLRAAPRGQVTIQVRFELDESGTLNVFAMDVTTGREASATLQLVGIAGAASVQSMRARQAATRLGV